MQFGVLPDMSLQDEKNIECPVQHVFVHRSSPHFTSSGVATPFPSWAKVWPRMLSSLCSTCLTRWWLRTRRRQVCLFVFTQLSGCPALRNTIKRFKNVRKGFVFPLRFICIRTSYPSGLWGARQLQRTRAHLSSAWPGSSRSGSTGIRRCGEFLPSHLLTSW